MLAHSPAKIVIDAVERLVEAPPIVTRLGEQAIDRRARSCYRTHKARRRRDVVRQRHCVARFESRYDCNNCVKIASFFLFVADQIDN